MQVSFLYFLNQREAFKLKLKDPVTFVSMKDLWRISGKLLRIWFVPKKHSVDLVPICENFEPRIKPSMMKQTTVSELYQEPK